MSTVSEFLESEKLQLGWWWGKYTYMSAILVSIVSDLRGAKDKRDSVAQTFVSSMRFLRQTRRSRFLGRVEKDCQVEEDREGAKVMDVKLLVEGN